MGFCVFLFHLLIFSILNVKYCVQDVRTVSLDANAFDKLFKADLPQPHTATQTCGPASPCHRHHFVSEIQFTWIFLLVWDSWFFLNSLSVFHFNVVSTFFRFDNRI